MSDQKIFRTASLLILSNHKILLLLRDNKSNVPNPNTWCLIGGFINDKENEEDAARREAKEEAGANLDQLHRIGTHEYTDGRISPHF